MKFGGESPSGSTLFPAPLLQTPRGGELFRAWAAFHDGLCHSDGTWRNKARTQIHILMYSL